MIRARDAVATARSLLGTPYSEMDCIGLIKRVIRTAPGGVSGYTTAGTNTLWKSYEASSKYRDLTWRQEGLTGARAGMLAFKRSGEDVRHVGLVTGEGTVIHSSSAKGRVVETALTAAEGWNLLAVHRHIETASGEEQSPSATGCIGEENKREELSPSAAKDATTLINNDGYMLTIIGDWRIAED